MQIIDLQSSHLEEAASLFQAACRAQWTRVPVLAASHNRLEEVIPNLQACLERYPGVAAVENGRLVGYLTGRFLPQFLGTHKGVYCPEWAHSALPADSFAIYRRLYQAIGRQWVDEGCLTHAINLLDGAVEARDAFFWNGFGAICFDGMAPVQPLVGSLPPGCQILPVRTEDIPVWLPLVDALQRHLADAPVFKPYLAAETEDDLAQVLAEPGNQVWLAWQNGEAIGFMQVTRNNQGAAWIVNGERNIAINGACTRPEYRGQGIARLLLSTVMEWALQSGYESCSVDFEATNIEACQFWPRHFQPVCRSLVRRLDPRILPANR